MIVLFRHDNIVVYICTCGNVHEHVLGLVDSLQLCGQEPVARTSKVHGRKSIYECADGNQSRAHLKYRSEEYIQMCEQEPVACAYKVHDRRSKYVFIYTGMQLWDWVIEVIVISAVWRQGTNENLTMLG